MDDKLFVLVHPVLGPLGSYDDASSHIASCHRHCDGLLVARPAVASISKIRLIYKKRIPGSRDPSSRKYITHLFRGSLVRGKLKYRK